MAKFKLPTDRPLIIDLGCGLYTLQGAIGIDCDPTVEPDILHDLFAGIPLPDDSVDELFTANFIEHVPPEKSEFIFGEIWRVCKPGSKITIIVPSYGHPSAHVPEHPVSISSRAFGDGDAGMGIFRSWFNVTDIQFDYDKDTLALAREYFPQVPDEVLGKLFLGVIWQMTVTCTPKGKGEWTHQDGRREHHWRYYAFEHYKPEPWTCRRTRHENTRYRGSGVHRKHTDKEIAGPWAFHRCV